MCVVVSLWTYVRDVEPTLHPHNESTLTFTGMMMTLGAGTSARPPLGTTSAIIYAAETHRTKQLQLKKTKKKTYFFSTCFQLRRGGQIGGVNIYLYIVMYVQSMYMNCYTIVVFCAAVHIHISHSVENAPSLCMQGTLLSNWGQLVPSSTVLRGRV